jgi:iron(III) transport system permease protein
MTRWRWAIAVILIALVTPPIYFAAGGLANSVGWSAWRDYDRLLILALSSLALAGVTTLIALPIGTLFAILLYKSNLAGRHFLRRLVVVGLFVPLPLLATAWQSAFGGGLSIFTNDPGRSWPSGLPVAAMIHALASLPWVIWLVGQGLMWIEPELEDDAALAAGPWTVIWHVSLPRAAPAIAAALVWIAVQTTTEITITDMTLVRTFAEEVYSQFVLPDDPGALQSPELAVRRAAAVAIPPMIGLAIVVTLGMRSLERRAPGLQTSQRDRSVIVLGPRSRRFAFLLVLVVILGGFVVGPLWTLMTRAGSAGVPSHWTAATALTVLHSTVAAHGGIVLGSALLATAVGIAAAVLGVLAAWLARESSGFRGLVVVLAALSWAAPAPVIGIGLKEVIRTLLDWEQEWNGHLFANLLYDRPSMLPVFWADLIRLWPYAFALLWPAARAVPRELLEAARCDGATPWQELKLVIIPSVGPAMGCAVVAVGVLALGELGASKIVATVGGETLAHAVFTQMHYGVTSTLAAQCLLLFALVLPIVLFPWQRMRRES